MSELLFVNEQASFQESYLGEDSRSTRNYEMTKLTLCLAPCDTLPGNPFNTINHISQEMYGSEQDVTTPTVHVHSRRQSSTGFCSYFAKKQKMD